MVIVKPRLSQILTLRFASGVFDVIKRQFQSHFSITLSGYLKCRFTLHLRNRVRPGAAGATAAPADASAAGEAKVY